MTRHLEVVSGPDKGRRFSLADGQTLVIGRGQASDTKINDPHMSRIHCRVQVDDGATWLLDGGSTTGTLVAGKPIEKVELQPGDVFQVGGTQIRYRLDDVADETTLGGQELVVPPKPQPKVKPLQKLVGEKLAHFRLEKFVAAGNTGMVFKARDEQQDRDAAVKVLTPDYMNQEEQRERFVRAMKTMLPIRHPNIVQLYAAGKSGPYCWAAMQYVDGECLTDVIQRIGIEGMLDWREVWKVAVQIGRALREANQRKIIHRNVTPTNILRRHADKVCLLGDLMLAKALEGSLAAQVTKPGQLIGDVPYMSPERTRDGASVDGRSDIYGLGAMCYALLTGHPPFESNSLPELVRMVRQQVPPRPRETQMAINELFEDAVMRMIAKDPDERFQDAGSMVTELERIGKYNNLQADWSEWVG